MPPKVSIIIPNYNGAATLDACLRAATGLEDETIEVIVVDDGSTDCSGDIIKRYPCQLIRLKQHSGASHARNVGAEYARGEWLFFTDADCVINHAGLRRLRERFATAACQRVIGGTYTLFPHDNRFFSRFQSVFIHYSETKHMATPDYVASHALAIKSKTFRASGGFNETMGPILEDVEFSHRLRRAGIKLVMEPGLQVQHIFNYSLLGSWRNAIRKSRYWIEYSLNNRDLLTDSGTASVELKVNVCTYYICLVLLVMSIAGYAATLPAVVFLAGSNLLLSRGLLKVLYAANTPLSGLGSIFYYLAVYPIPVGIGSLAGLLEFVQSRYRHGSHA